MERRRTEIENAIDEYVLHERDRRLLKRRMIDGLTQEAIAEEFGISVACVKLRINKWKRVVNDHC